MDKIPNSVVKIENGYLPDSVAQTFDEDKEAKPFLISFEKYCDKLCELDSIEKSTTKKILKTLKLIGRLTRFEEFIQYNIKGKHIIDEGDYKKLYSGLDLQTEIKEDIYADSDRMFYFIINNKFYIRAITHKHFETNKNRK